MLLLSSPAESGEIITYLTFPYWPAFRAVNDQLLHDIGFDPAAHLALDF
jgi:hypothetical protein